MSLTRRGFLSGLAGAAAGVGGSAPEARLRAVPRPGGREPHDAGPRVPGEDARGDSPVIRSAVVLALFLATTSCANSIPPRGTCLEGPDAYPIFDRGWEMCRPPVVTW